MTTMTYPTVRVTCACGASFDREVKRGRPQIWCPTCLTIPYYERVGGQAPKVPTPKPPPAPKPVKVKPVKVKPVAVEVAEEASPAPVSFDPYISHRDQIEAEVAAVYVDHAARYAARIAAGEQFLNAASATSAETRELLKAVYAKFPKAKADKKVKGGDSEDQ